MKNRVKGTRKLTSANTATNATAFLMEALLRDGINTAEVVMVVAVDNGGPGSMAGYVDVKPLVAQTDAYNNALPVAVMARLPYLRLQGGRAALVVDPQPGDIGLAVFCKRDSSGVKQGAKEPVPPASFRIFDQADGFYVGGFLNTAPEVWLMLDSITGDIELSTKAANVGISCRESGNIDIKTNAGSVNIEGSGVSSIKAPFIRLDGNVQIIGGLLADGVDLLKHIHSGVEPGNGQSGPPKGIGNVSSAINFNWLKEYMLERDDLTDKDRLLLCIPSIAQAIAERSDGVDAQGWRYLQSMFYYWFAGPGNTDARANPNLLWVDWNWIMSFERAEEDYDDFVRHLSVDQLGETSNIYNLKSRGQIASYLQRDNRLTSQREEFDYSQLPPEQWLSRSFNYHEAARQNIPPFDGLQAAMGAFTFRALARGYCRPNDKGGHSITITGVKVFVYDTFNFEKESFWDEVFGYGYWSCVDKTYSTIFLFNGQRVFNIDFNAFRNRYNFGNDFQVLSQLHEVVGFREMRYDYP